MKPVNLSAFARTATRWLSIAALATALVGCQDRATSADSVTVARDMIAKGNAKDAIVHLKSAMQSQAGTAEMRYLLGKALLQDDQPSIAEVELRKALDGGHNHNDVVPLLATAMLATRKSPKLLEEWSATVLTDSPANAALSTTIAEALLMESRIPDAQSRLDRVFESSPDYLPALLLKSRLHARKGEVKEALDLIARALSVQPDYVDALLLSADFRANLPGELPMAISQYQKVIELRPQNVHAYSAMVSIELSRGDRDAANKYWRDLKKAQPAHLQTLFLEAQLALEASNIQLARELSQKLVRAAPDHAGVVLLAGMVEARAGVLKQAENYLVKSLSLNSESGSTRALLADVYQRSGQFERATSTLAPLLARKIVSASTFMQAAELALKQGNLRQAEEMYSRAARVKPDDAKILTAIAVVEISSGRVNDGLRSLRSLAQQQPAETAADEALVISLLSRRDFEGALAALAALDAKQPGDPATEILRGRIHLVRHDRSAARRSFESAIARRAGHFPSVAALATLDVSERDFASAQKRYEDFLSSKPPAAAASLAYRALAGVKFNAGKAKSEVMTALRDAVKSDRSSVPAWVGLADGLLRTRESKAAVAAAVEGLSVNPDAPDLLEVLGRAQMASSDINQAINTFNRLAQLLPRSPLPQYRLAETYLSSGDEKQALLALRRAVDIDPGNVDAQKSLVSLALRKNHTQEVLNIARDIQKRWPASALGHRLEGEIHAALGNNAEAVAAFRRGLDMSDAGRLPMRLHGAMLRAGPPRQAEIFASTWLKAKPEDAAFAKYLADEAMVRKDYASAERFYEMSLRHAPDEMMALNNLAWLKTSMGKSGAVPLAERAVNLAPGMAAVLETLAKAQLAENLVAQAVETTRRMLALEPTNPAFQLSAARVFLASGDRAAASAALSKVEGSNAGTQLKSDAAALRHRLPS